MTSWMRAARQRTRPLQLALWALLLVLGSHALIAQPMGGTAFGVFGQQNDRFATLYEVYGLVRELYIDPYDVPALVEGAVDGLVEAVEDEALRTKMRGVVAASVSFDNVADADPANARAVFAPVAAAYDAVVAASNQPLSEETLVEGAILGMVNALGDPYSGYIPRRVFELANQDLSGEIEGIGVVISTDEETSEIVVRTVIINAPAALAGVLPGDVFLEVEGEDVTRITQAELAQRVRGPAGSDVNITFRREGEPINLTITRQRIEVPVVASTLFEEANVAYVRLFEFNPRSRTQLDLALRDLDAANRDGLILDLRGNPGGTLNSAIDIASAFIREGVVLTEEFASGPDRVFEVNGNYANVEVPLVLLVDEDSASGSELVAGALQDTGRALLIGETTFGKGTVQIWQSLGNGGGVRITNGRWLTPNGRWIHRRGVTPDITIPYTPDNFLFTQATPDTLQDDLQVQAALEALLTGMVPQAPAA